MTEFQKVINEMLSGATIPTGENPSETLVNPSNDDFYARGDARRPSGINRRRKSKSKRKMKRKKKSLKEATRHVDKLNGVPPKQYEDLHPEVEPQIITQLGFQFSKMKTRFRCINEITQNILIPAKQMNARVWGRKPRKRVFRNINWKQLKRDLDDNLESDSYFVCAAINSSKDEITFEYEIY